ncbi:hypothetical protein [Aliarcobacter cryaerophilus]|uniref:hypothetical protein n=1 Tax=Aliarcobacter cryaerophilus TaxID=28198 RepID=UPI0021B22049|nr:hypothetical protein [Aliarcobacter cryaerophilus]MCT7500356.1 hypothetical protein [Aliarcobacter cryaerophilus]MCT7542894.1 hypothetical protein [Aliarcobacter cryaerophilus]
MNKEFNLEQNFLKIWETPTDPKHLKNVSSNGRNYSAIDSTYQFLQATEIFNGCYGSTWGLKDLDYTFKTLADTELLILKAKFFYPGGEFELNNSIKLAYMTNGYQNKPGYLKVDDEAYKKIETNTISKALAKLGFNADVFMGKFEDNNYVQELNYAYADIPGKKIDTEKIIEIQAILKAQRVGLDSLLNNYQVKHLGQLNEEQYIDIKNKLGDKK